jgi:hypothetical protein
LAYEAVLQNPNGEIFETPEYTLAISGTASPYLNCVVRTMLRPESDVDGCIENVLDQARKRSIRMTWFIMPGTLPADLGSKLEAHGLEYTGDDPGMTIDLHTLPERVPTPDGLKIVEVLDLGTLEQWVSAWGDSYEANEAKRQGRFSFRASLGLSTESPYRSYLAYWNGQPVATGFLGAGVSGCWVGGCPGSTARWRRDHLAPLLGRRLGCISAMHRRWFPGIPAARLPGDVPPAGLYLGAEKQT